MVMSQYDQGLVDGAAQVFKEMNENTYLLYADALRKAESIASGEAEANFTALADVATEYKGAARLCILVSMAMRKQVPTNEAVEQEMHDFATLNLNRYRAERT